MFQLINIIITVAVVFWVCVWFIKFVPKDKRLLLYSLGKFEGIRGPGLVFVIPAFHTYRMVSAETNIIEVALNQAQTADGRRANVKLNVYYWITDPEKAPPDTANHEALVSSAIQPVAIEQIAKHLLDNIQYDKRKISTYICSTINVDLREEGIQVGYIDIQLT